MDLLLPKLKRYSGVKPSDESGKWIVQDFETFGKVASSLNHKASGRVKSFSSVPTIWARPLLMEMSLHTEHYPIRNKMIEQWQGMLAAIALAEVRRFPLSAQLLELGKLRHSDPFARSLYELLPSSIHCLYKLENKNPWQDIYVFLWNHKPVGMSSPSTLVVPSEEGRWEGLPWWNRLDFCLKSPQSYINTSEKALLWRWVENLRNELNKHNGKMEALDMVRGLLEEFQDSLGNYPEQRLCLSSNPRFFGVPLNRGVLTALNLPVKSEPQESCVRLIASTVKKGKISDLILIDSEIARAWDESPQDIWIYQNQTLASLNIDDLKDRKIIWQDVQWIESKDLFLPEFSFIDLENALPGAFLPDEARLLTFKGQYVTPLLPLNPILLDYFTPEDLISKIQLTLLNGSDGPSVRVVLHLSLSGLKNDDSHPQNYSIYKDYPIKEENALTEVPVLELWPHFRAEGWREYYGFYYDNQVLASTRPGDKTFQVSLPEAKELKDFQDGRGSYQITRLEEFPAFIDCQDESRNPIGLILLKTPEQLQLTASWTVGVDFGTSYTNIYVNRRGTSEPLPLQSLHLKIADAQTESRFPALAEYFIPENFYPLEKPLPLASLLTTRGGFPNSTKERPIFEGRIYIPSPSFDPNEEWYKTDLKWKNLEMNLLFLKHLALHITAMAAKNGVKQIQWSLSYPSAFSRSDRIRYAGNWRNITDDLQAKTGITHFCPEPDNFDYFRTESLATAQYFADLEGYDLVNSTCINMGDDTSDISIWEADTTNFKLVHQCSIRLAGRHLLAQFLELNPNFLVQRFDLDPQDWQGLKAGNFNAKLDLKLRYESDNWLKKRDFLEGEVDFQGLIRLMAIGTAGLYYYVGTILRVLYQRGDYSRNEITPVYLGGNGSRLLNWLAIGGFFDRHCEVNELFSRMLSKSSGFEDTREITRLSCRPKDEVACGLVLNSTRLKVPNIKKAEPLIAGEDFIINGEPISWEDDVDLQGNIKGFDIPELYQVRKFLDEFNLALKDLDIEGLTPMPAFQANSLEPSYSSRLWRNTLKDLKRELVQIRGDSENIRVEPPFILGLKSLLRILGKEWAS